MLRWLIDSPDGPAGGWFAARVFAAALTAFLVAAGGGGHIIEWLRRRRIGERTDKTPIEDTTLLAQINAKADTPTMGGLIILAGLLPAVLLWGDLGNVYLWLFLGCFLALGAAGMADDWLKLTGAGHRSRGLKVRHKLLIQGAVGAGFGTLYWLRMRAAGPAGLPVPMLRNLVLVLGPLTIAWTALVVATMSNAVNVADGLDGLAGGLLLVALAPLGLLAAGPWAISVSGSDAAVAELAPCCAALGGAVLGFLWHNWHPARVFMGDTGSLAVGGSIGLAAVMTRTELLLPLVGFVLLAEFGSSVLQVLWFKATGRRILPIAPLHYIWQRRGIPETHIVWRMCTVGALASGVALLIL